MDTMECPIELTNVMDHEIHLQRLDEMDFVTINNDLRINYVDKSHMEISLCRMQPIPMVYPIMDVDADMLE